MNDIKIRRVSYIFYQVFYTLYVLLHNYVIKYKEFEKQCKQKYRDLKNLEYKNRKIINKIKNNEL